MSTQDLINKADARFRQVDPAVQGRYSSSEVMLSVLLDTWDALYAAIAEANQRGANLTVPGKEE